MHAHAGKTEGRVNDAIGIPAAFQQALLSYTSLKKEWFHRCVRTLPFINDAQKLTYQYHQLPLDFN